MSEAAVITHRNLGDIPSSSVGSVLIIDDEAAIRESLQTLLELEGYQVVCSATGEDGLQAASETTFDVILLDLALPGISGMEVLRDLRAHDASVTVVMITAYGT